MDLIERLGVGWSRSLTRRAGVLRWVAACSLALAVAACGGGGDAAAPTAAEAVPQLRADAVAACGYQHVYITVEQVRVRQSAADGRAWIDIGLPVPRRIDLMASGGLLQALGAAPLAPGGYSEMRLVMVTPGSDDELAHAVQFADGSFAPVRVPSGTNRGIELEGNLVVPPGRTGDVVLPGFDACAALKPVGNSGKYQLKSKHPAAVLLLPPPTETRLPEGRTLPVAGGGYVMMRLQSANVWTLQRFDAQGTPGTITTVAPAMGSADSEPTILPLAGGGYAATWLRLVRFERFGGSLYDVLTQGFSAAGTALGAPQAVGQTIPFMYANTPRPLTLPEMAALPGGGYVIVWALPSFADRGVYVRRFNADGTPAGSVQQAAVNGFADLGVVGLSTGGYLVTWAEDGIYRYSRAYTASDMPRGPAQSTGLGYGFYRTHLAPLTGGGAVMSWLGDSAPSPHYVHVVQFAPDGTPRLIAPVVQGPAEPALGSGADPAAVGLPDGGYVVAWFAGGEVHARRFAATGTPLGNETRINVSTTAPQGPVAVVAMASGGFLITWSGIGPDGTRANYGREFAAGGLIASS